LDKRLRNILKLNNGNYKKNIQNIIIVILLLVIFTQRSCSNKLIKPVIVKIKTFEVKCDQLFLESDFQKQPIVFVDYKFKIFNIKK
jgi:hypothetical protein